MNFRRRNAHPAGRGRYKDLPVLKLAGIGAHAHSGGSLPEHTSGVSISWYLDDEAERGAPDTATYCSLTFTLDDDPDKLDALIGKLTDLRAHQRARRQQR